MIMENTEIETEANSITPKRERWEELYEKYAESVKNPTNLYLANEEEIFLTSRYYWYGVHNEK